MLNSEEHTIKTEKPEAKKSEYSKEQIKSDHKDQLKEQIKSEQNSIKSINIINYSSANSENSIVINFNESDYSFGVYSVNKTFLGKFSGKDLIKFVTNKIYPHFLENINAESTFPLIQKYICDVHYINDSYKIILLNHLESPFMGNIEMIIKLYQGIIKSNNLVKLEIDKISDNIIKQQVIKILKQLSYVILNYSLRLISQISDKIKDDNSQNLLKESLMKYSVMIVYKLNTFMRDEIEDKTFAFKSLQDDLIRIGNLKIDMYKKINDLGKKINDQSLQMTELKFKFSQMENTKHISNTSNINPKDNFSSTSEIVTFTNDTNSGINSGTNSSYMFNDSDCYFTESGNDEKINYFSPKKI
jgi:hypothetical protein